MRTLLLTTTLSLLIFISFGQPLTGIKTIPGDFATLQSAITALNTRGVGSGGVIFNIASGFTETFTSPTAGTITATGTATDTIVFRKSGTGVNPLITSGTGTTTSTDGIIKLTGSDYITFDGINLKDNPANNTTTKMMEWGFALVKKQNISPFNGCQHVVIKNCKVTLSQGASSRGIYLGNHIATSTTGLLITSTLDANSYNRFYNDTLVGCMEPVSLNGYSLSTFYDQNNEIGVSGGNMVTGFSGARGIYSIYQNNLKIANNTINNTGTSNADLSGIYASTASSAKIQIWNNTITVINSSATAAYLTGIKCYTGSNTAGSTVRIYNNTVKNCNYSAGVANEFRGIDIGTAPDSVFIYGNSVVNNTVPGTGILTAINIYPSTGPANLLIYSNTISGNLQSGPNGAIYGISTTNSKSEVYSNLIFSNSMPNASGTQYMAEIIGYYHSGTGTNSKENIHDNEIYNLSITGSNTSPGSKIFGICSYSSGEKYFIGNKIHGFINKYGSVKGIELANGDTARISRNNIYDLTCNNGFAGTTVVSGINVISINYNLISNNFISDLKTSSASASEAITGIAQSTLLLPGQKLYLMYNTILLNATSSGSDFGTTAFSCDNLSDPGMFVLRMNNNIFANLSVPKGSGFTVAFRKEGSGTSGYSTLSNNNAFYTTPLDPYHLLFYNGSLGIWDMEYFKYMVSPRESKSFCAAPPFINISSAPYDLHMNPSVSSLFESDGVVVGSPFPVNSDVDLDPRYPEAGYPNDPSHPAMAPDIGADEFAGIHLDIVPPVITFTELEKTLSLQERTLTATITDDFSGMPQSGTGLPVLYWRIRHGNVQPWQGVQGSYTGNDHFDFTFGSGATVHDTIDYYIAAQDLAPTPNVTSSNADYFTGTYSCCPPALNSEPDGWTSYIIMGTLCGTYYVGVGQDFETLTRALRALDVNIAGCAITFLLADEEYPNEDSYLSTGPYPWSDSLKTVTIKPAPGVTPRLAENNWASFYFSGSSYITIDGSNVPDGNDRSLTIENISTNNGTAVIRFSSDGIHSSDHCTIKNCVLSGGGNAYATIGIYGNSLGNNHLTIEGNEVLKVAQGIYLSSWGNNLQSGIISHNKLGDPVDTLSLGYSGIEVNYVDGYMISDNLIQNLNCANGNLYGIIAGQGTTNTNIERNTVTGIRYNGSNGYEGKGIDIATGLATSNIEVANNVVSDILGNISSDLSWNGIAGIRVQQQTGGVHLYYNSVNLSGVIHGNADGGKSAALYLENNIADIALKNNVLTNSLFDTVHTALTYAIYCDAPISVFTGIDYNDYYTSGSQGMLGFLGINVPALSDWRLTTGQDQHSQSSDPLFSSDTDLQPAAGSPLLGNGVPLPSIIRDRDGNLRSAVTPTIGAFELAKSQATKSLNLKLFLEGLYSGNGSMNQAQDETGNHFESGVADRITVELHNSSDYSVIEYTTTPVDLHTDGTLSLQDLPSSMTGSYFLTIRHRSSIETTSSSPISFSGTLTDYDFTTAASQAFGDNQREISGVYAVWGGDVNQDGIVDASDMNPVDNASTAITFGYIPEDVNGDGIVDGGDMNIVDNNSTAIIFAITP